MGKRSYFNLRNTSGPNFLRKNLNTAPMAEDAVPPVVMGGEIAPLLLDRGLGQNYDSLEQFNQMTGKPILGLGLSHVSEKLKNLKASKFSKPKNIRFTL